MKQQTDEKQTAAMHRKRLKDNRFLYKGELESLVKNMEYDIFEKDEEISRLNRVCFKWRLISAVSWTIVGFLFVVGLVYGIQ